MDKEKLISEFNRLFDKYVNNTVIFKNMDKDKIQYQVKAILGKLDKQKKKDYAEADIETIKDTYFC